MAHSIAFPARAITRYLSLNDPLVPVGLGDRRHLRDDRRPMGYFLHRSIGRDTFWTPPHMAIYLCGIIAGISSAYLILATSLGKLPEVRLASVRMWGFHG